MRLKLLSLLFFLLQFNSFSKEIKGMSFSAPSKEIFTDDLSPIVDINANWISIVPYSFLKDNEISFDSKWQWWGERSEGIRKTIQMSKKRGLKVMLKPHVWIGHSNYTGDFSCGTEEEWKKFEDSYKAYIMTFVKIAVEEDVEMFCIGTEWRKSIAERPFFWTTMIDEIKSIYNGKIIYAANWDDFDDVPFWNKLDFIGIDSYFPLSIVENPNLKQMKAAWTIIINLLKKYSTKMNQKIVFTEFGFRSTTVATIKPWEFGTDDKYSAKVQDNAFKSFFQTIWLEDWFSGGFIWKWYKDHKNSGGKGDTDFTPQNKLAEETIRQAYGRN